MLTGGLQLLDLAPILYIDRNRKLWATKLHIRKGSRRLRGGGSSHCVGRLAQSDIHRCSKSLRLADEGCYSKRCARRSLFLWPSWAC